MTLGRVIRGFGRVVPKVVLDARGEAEALVAAARADADAIRGGLAAERDRARAEGRAEGLAEVAATLAAARADAERTREAAAPAAIVLARKMAEKIVGRAVELRPDTVADIVAAALASCRPRGGAVKVRVHPDDHPHAAARASALAAHVPAGTLEIVADPSVPPHGCIVDTAQGRLDARLDTQLDALERALGGGARG